MATPVTNQARPQAKFLRAGPVAITASAYGILFDAPEIAAPFNDQGVATVTICGPLLHHAAGSYGLDSYEAILSRIQAALATDAEVVELKIDSPGGDVFGAFETARAARSYAKAAGKRLVTYVDGQAASAGYILACAGDQIYIPETGCVGSIGVVDMMGSAARQEKAMGIDIAIVTSGERKADGNPHLPISEGSLAAAQAHVDELAGLFYAWVAETRGISVEAVQGFQAAQFTGASAVAAGLADQVVPFHELRPLLGRGTNSLQARTIPGTTSAMKKTFKEIQAMFASALAGGPTASKYTDAMAALAALAEEGNEDAKKAMKKMLTAAADDKEAPADSSAPPAKKSSAPPAKSKAPGAQASVDLSGVELVGRIVELENTIKASALATERSTLLAARPDLTADPKMAAWLTKATIETVRHACETIPKAAVVPVPQVQATLGADQGTISGMAPDQTEALKQKMGLAPTPVAKVSRIGFTSVFGGSPEQIEIVKIEKGSR